MGNVLLTAGGIILSFIIMGSSMLSVSSSGSSGSGSGSGVNRRGESSIQIEGINLYNSDGSVNQEKIAELEKILTEDYLNTIEHKDTKANQDGPFLEYWGPNRHNGLAYFQCTWWADGRADQFRDVCLGKEREEWFHSEGNGAYVVTNAKNSGWDYGTVPQMNSVVSFNSGDGVGHVAYVEAVDKITKDIYISHAGDADSWYGIEKISPNSDGTYYCAGRSTGFIYLDDGSTKIPENELSRLINARNPLKEGEEPSNLVTISSDMKACSEVVDAYNSMVQAASKDNVSIWVCSAYRTYQRQAEKFNSRSDKNLNAISFYQSPLTSEHRTRFSN